MSARMWKTPSRRHKPQCIARGSVSEPSAFLQRNLWDTSTLSSTVPLSCHTSFSGLAIYVSERDIRETSFSTRWFATPREKRYLSVVTTVFVSLRRGQDIIHVIDCQLDFGPRVAIDDGMVAEPRVLGMVRDPKRKKTNSIQVRCFGLSLSCLDR